MRPIHTAELDQRRPALILTRELARGAMARITVAPISTRVRGLATEVAVGPANGLESAGVVSCDNVVTVARLRVGPQIGRLLPEQEAALAAAILAAFDLEA